MRVSENRVLSRDEKVYKILVRKSEGKRPV
jgi:hypothetical protein